MIQTPTPSQLGELTWEVSELFPRQGEWTEEAYLRLDTRRPIELSEGKLEMLPMPTQWHQIIALFLYEQLRTFTRDNQLGLTLAAPLRIRLWDNKMRESDVVFMLAKNSDRRGNRCWERADLVMEVVSEDDPDRDVVTKRNEYAQAGILEYWIVDPRSETINVLSLVGANARTSYRETGNFTVGQQARSELLPGFSVAVSEVFDRSREY